MLDHVLMQIRSISLHHFTRLRWFHSQSTKPICVVRLCHMMSTAQGLIIQLPKARSEVTSQLIQPRVLHLSVSQTRRFDLSEVPAAGTRCPEWLGMRCEHSQGFAEPWSSGLPVGSLTSAGRMWVNYRPFTSASGIHKVGLFYSQRKAGESPERKLCVGWGDRWPPERSFATARCVLVALSYQTPPNTESCVHTLTVNKSIRMFYTPLPRSTHFSSGWSFIILCVTVSNGLST